MGTVHPLIHPERIAVRNRQPVKNRAYVLYWMQQSQRAEYNHALEYAVSQANRIGKPLIVYFGISSDFPEANLRHYQFMLEGLQATDRALDDRGLKMVVRIESPDQGVARIARNACMVVTDRGYLRIQRQWRTRAMRSIDCAVHEIESDVIVPVARVSSKEEYSAATIRPKIHSALPEFMVPLPRVRILKDSLGVPLRGISLRDIYSILARLKIDTRVAAVRGLKGGTHHAKRMLNDFIVRRLASYDELRNDPNADITSCMSPYLHFGQISPVYIALQVARSRSKSKDAYLEELIVRRELSMNFCFYNRHYDSIKALPAWAQQTLRRHDRDARRYVYSRTMLERARTHDPYWNAAQIQMLVTGKMHGYMRMYWGKKILEWTRNPRRAYATALFLNNKYELDGRDPNGFAGVAWCFGKHDRPWAERPIYGMIRYMNEKGLRRKFNADAYAASMNALRAHH